MNVVRSFKVKGNQGQLVLDETIRHSMLYMYVIQMKILNQNYNIQYKI